MTTVDIVIPCYNYARYLKQCVKSVLSQKGVSTRVLVIDDCSTDETSVVGRHLASQFKEVEYRRHSKNIGHIATYNEGLMGWATAKYSLLLSADDALTAGALRRATTVMNKHPEVGMTFGQAVLVWDDDPLPDHPDSDYIEYKVISSSDFLQRCCLNGNPVPTPAAVVRTKLQKALGGYDARFPHSGDLEMWMRFAANRPVIVLKVVQAFYRKHASNMSIKYYNQLINDRRETMMACDEVLQTWGGKFAASASWRHSMRKRLSEEAFWEASRAFELGEDAKHKKCLEFAVEVNPDIRFNRMWWRLRAKKCLGRTIGTYVSKLCSYWRGNKSVESMNRIKIGSVDKTIGWWPET